MSRLRAALLWSCLGSFCLAVACGNDEPVAPDDAGRVDAGSSGVPADDAGVRTDAALDDATAPENDAGPIEPSADALLLDEIQKTTFRYFWDFAHPISGMTRERSTSNETTTSGGTGFGVQSIIVAVSRGWISREQAVTRLTTLVDFLGRADRFHGAWSHWIHGTTGRAIPFSAKDDGGDLVETALLLQGLLSARAYFDADTAAERALRETITTLWEGVDFTHYQRNDVLYWHWSPNHGWDMNLPIRGWNESLIVYVLALGSPTHSIATRTYTQGWTHPGYRNNRQFEGYQLPLGPNYGGPLFLAHYSFLGMDPRKMADGHASYWYQNVVHTRINRAYCIDSAPSQYGYSADLWGLTASDTPGGYTAHSPTNDNGTISPTAALSSMPYTPHESLQVARHLRQMPGVFGEYGFADALNPSQSWIDPQYISIDQGPIIVMIENYRSRLMWNLFMPIEEVRTGLTRASIHDPDHASGFYLGVRDAKDDSIHLVRHPDRGAYEIDVALRDAGNFTLLVQHDNGVDANLIWDQRPGTSGTQVVDLGDLAPGRYTIRLTGSGVDQTRKLVLH